MRTKRDDVFTRDPHFDEWITVAHVAGALGDWETVLRLYFASYVRFGTRGTSLFECKAFREWQSVNPDATARLNREERERWEHERK